MAKGEKHAETTGILGRLEEGDRDDLVILFIPSHDKAQKPISTQANWASEALDLFSELYGGATGFTALRGGWKDGSGTILYDEPIMVQSLALRPRVVNEISLHRLLGFCKRMGKQTNQASIGLIFNDVMHFIEDFRGA